MRLKPFFLVMAAAAVGLGRSASADFVNGNFETGDFTGWTITPTPNGQSPVQVVVQWDIDFGDPKPTSFVGRFSVGQVTFQSGVPAGIELTQSLNLNSGETYSISFDWSAHRVTSGNNAQGGIFDLIVNGTSFANAAAGSTGSTLPKWGSLSTNYTAGFSGAHTIGVRITRPFTVPADLFQSVDNFSLTSSIPEPGTIWVMGMLATTGLMTRRRSAVAR